MPEIHSVQRLRQLTESSFNTDGTGTLGNYTDTPFVEGTLSVDTVEAMLDPQYAQQSKDGYPTQLVGLRSSALSFDINMASTGVAANTATTAVQGALGELLAVCLGGEELSIGTTSVGGTDEDTFEVTAGKGTAAAPGGSIIGWANASGLVEARPVKTEASDTITLRLAFSGTATTGNAIYSSSTYYLAEDPTSSLQFLAEGVDPQNRFLVSGMQLSTLGITAGIGELPRMNLAFQGADWLDSANTAGSITATLGSSSYTQVSPTHVIGEAFIQAEGTQTLPTALAVSGFTFAPGVTYVPQTSHSAQTSNTIARWVRDRAAPVMSGTFTVPYEDLTYHNLRTNKTIQQLLIQFGSTAGSIVAFDFPSIQIIDAKITEVGRIASVEVSFVCRRDDTTTGTDTDLRTSAVRIAFL